MQRSRPVHFLAVCSTLATSCTSLYTTQTHSAPPTGTEHRCIASCRAVLHRAGRWELRLCSVLRSHPEPMCILCFTMQKNRGRGRGQASSEPERPTGDEDITEEEQQEEDQEQQEQHNTQSELPETEPQLMPPAPPLPPAPPAPPAQSAAQANTQDAPAQGS